MSVIKKLKCSRLRFQVLNGLKIRKNVHSFKKSQMFNFLMLSNKGSHLLKMLIVRKSMYNLLLPTSIKRLKVFFSKI